MNWLSIAFARSADLQVCKVSRPEGLHYTCDRLERESRSEVDARARADAVRDDEIETERRHREPDAAADPLRKRLIAEALAFVVDGADVDERADTELADADWRGERRANFRRAGDERVADRRSRSEAAEVG